MFKVTYIYVHVWYAMYVLYICIFFMGLEMPSYAR